MLPKIQKIHLDKEFNQIFKTGRSAYGRFLGVKIKENKLKYNRFAVILGLKVEKSAVKRHLLKRRLFKVLKEQQNNLNFFADCVIIALPSIKTADLNELKLELIEIFIKLSKKR